MVAAKHARLGAGVGWSRDPDAARAAAEAAGTALRASGGGPPALAIVYASVLYDQPAIVRAVRQALPGATVVGASTQDLSRTGSVETSDRVLGVAVIGGAPLGLRSAAVRDVSKSPAASAAALAAALGPAPGPDSPPLLLWYDPLTGINVDALIAGLADAGYRRVVGGGAGQPWGPLHRTYQYLDDEVLSGSVVALQLGPEVELVYELTHGTDTLGLELEVTDSEGNVLRTIGGRPALDVWREQLGLGEQTVLDIDTTAAWALGVSLPAEIASHYEGPITRSVFGFRPRTREVVLQAPIPRGTWVQVCHRTPEAVFDRAIGMAERLKARLGGRTPLLALGFECAARARPFLGEELSRREITRMQDILGKDLPWLGMYAWGEIAPVGAVTCFHNYTFPLGLLLAREADK